MPNARAMLVPLAVISALCAACSGGGDGGGVSVGSAPPQVTMPGGASGPAGAWAVYGGNARHANVAASASPAGRPAVAWHARLDGAVYGEPLLVGGTVIAATENDSVYALDAATGQVRWQRHVGSPVPLSDLPCGGIDPLGITGTPVYDQANGLVYVVAETSGYHHVLAGLSVTSGAVRVERDIPAPDGQPRYDQQRPGLVIEGSRVYVAFGGLEGDCGPYRGSVAAVPLDGAGPILSYLVPTTREGAIWGMSGPVIGPDGTLFISTGNGSDTSRSFDGSDAVTALTPALRRIDVFAPADWRAASQNDADLGSTQPALVGTERLLALGKTGIAYLLDARHLGGVGGQVASLPVCDAYGGSAVSGSTVYEPCDQGGMAAISTAGDRLAVLWRGPPNAQGSPVLAGGAVWVADVSGGTLYELDPATGTVRHSVSLGIALPHFTALSAAGEHAYLGTLDGVIALTGA